MITQPVAPAARAAFRPAAVAAEDDRFVPLAAELGEGFAERAAEHDRENTFVAENFEMIRERGYLRLAVPSELGGLGASMRQVCYAQAELAKHCASTALAVNMHHYLVLANAYRWRHGATAAEGVLRRVAAEGIVLMTSGGSDGIWPSATAVKEDGGFRVSGRKMFCSQAPVADVLVTMAAHEDPDEGTVVLLMGIPTKSEGVRVVETWDAMGMRATASHDVELTNVAVSAAQIVTKRPWGAVDPALRNAGVHFGPPVAAVYFGVAAAARDEAVRVVSSRRSGDGQPLVQDATSQRLVGLMDQKLKVAWWSLVGALTELGDDYTPDEATLGVVMMAKRQVVIEAVEVVALAMEAVGGSAYFRRSPLERAYRDVRAGTFHPINPEKTLLLAGRLALGQSVETIW